LNILQNHLVLIVNQKNQQIINHIKHIRKNVDDNAIALKAYRIEKIISTYQSIFNKFVKILDRQKSSAVDMQQSLEKFKNELLSYIDHESEIVQQNVNTVEQITIAALVFIILAGVLTSIVVTRLITRPINLLKASAREIEVGNFETSVKIVSKDEIGELGKIFNLMVKQLKTNFTTLNSYQEHLEDKVKLRTLDLENEIEDRKKIETELIKEKQFNGLMLHWIESIVVILDFKGHVILFNKAAEACSGYKFEEVMNRPFWEFLIMPEEREAVERVIKNMNKEGITNVFQNYWLTKHSKKRLIIWHNTILSEPEGETKFILSTGHDITEKKKAEEALQNAHDKLELRVKERTEELNQSLVVLKQSQDELIRAERLIALGNMVSGVAHEINTPVGVAYTESTFLGEETKIIQRDLRSDQITKSQLEKFLSLIAESTASISRNLSRASGLIGSFKQVAVDQASEHKRKFKLKEYLDEVLLSLQSKLKQTKHQIEIECEEIEINSYPGIFSQIITNFIFNSLLHAFKENDQGTMLFNIFLKNEFLHFIYQDSGKGMEEKVLKQIFDPFFTTKRNQGGTGLGLNIVYNLVTQKLNGKIKCVSSPGKGTKFMIEIPL